MNFSISAFDILLVVVLGGFAVIGVLRGLVREVVTLVTWIVGVAAAWMLAPYAATWFEGKTESAMVRQLMGFISVFALVWLLGVVVGALITRMTHKGGVNLVNRIGGGVIGFARGAVIAVVIVLAAGLTSAPQQSWWRNSLLTPALERAALFTVQYLPEDVARHIRYS